jgi:hypothetical protein
MCQVYPVSPHPKKLKKKNYTDSCKRLTSSVSKPIKHYDSRIHHLIIAMESFVNKNVPRQLFSYAICLQIAKALLGVCITGRVKTARCRIYSLQTKEPNTATKLDSALKLTINAAQSFLSSKCSASNSRISQSFTDLESLLQCQQEPATGCYPKLN